MTPGTIHFKYDSARFSFCGDTHLEATTVVYKDVTCVACKRLIFAPGGPAHRGPLVAGVKHDEGKPPLSLLPFGALEEVARVLAYGAKKYQAWNWVRVADPERRYADAMLRHFTAWQAGEGLDTESGLPHLACLACNALFLLAHGEKTRDLATGEKYLEARNGQDHGGAG